MTPKNYIQEFIEVLKIEIEELKQAKDNNIILKNGTLYKNTGRYNISVFLPKQCRIQARNRF